MRTMFKWVIHWRCQSVTDEWLSKEHWWIHSNRGKKNESQKTLSYCHFVHHKSHLASVVTEPGPVIYCLSHSTAWETKYSSGNNNKNNDIISRNITAATLCTFGCPIALHHAELTGSVLMLRRVQQQPVTHTTRDCWGGGGGKDPIKQYTLWR
jgi:hypothetical protein